MLESVTLSLNIVTSLEQAQAGFEEDKISESGAGESSPFEAASRSEGEKEKRESPKKKRPR